MPYASPESRDIARLLSDRGRIASDAVYRRGLSSARTIADIGGLAAGTLGELARYQLEAPERARRARLLEREEASFAEEDAAKARRYAVDEAIKLTADPTTGRIDTARAAKEITLIDPVQGAKWWAQADEEQKAQVAADRERAQRISQWAGALRGVDPTRRPVLYTEGRNKLIADKVATPEQIPEEYDENWLTQTHLQALSIDKQLEALAPKEPKTRTITWNKPDGTEVTEVVEDVVGTKRESAPSAPANIDAAIFNAYRTRNFTEYRRLLGVKADMASAGREPDAPPQITQPQRAQAERWKLEQLAGLEKEYRESLVESPMSAAQLARRKLDIENAYRSQIGLQPLKALPASWNAPAAADDVAPPAPPEPPAPSLPRQVPAPAASPDKVVTVAELQAIAERRGTTVEQEETRATAAGYVVR